MIKRIAIHVICLTVLLVPMVVFAQSGGPCLPNSPTTGLCNALRTRGATDVPSFITSQLTRLAALVGTVFLFMLIYGGARMIFSGGDEATVKKAKETIKYSVSGFLVMSLAFVIVSAVRAFIAARNVDPNNTSGFENPLGFGDIESWAEYRVRRFLSFVGIAALLYLVVGGFRYMTAGNDEQVKSARKMITWAVIGLITVIISYTVMSTVIYTLNSANNP